MTEWHRVCYRSVMRWGAFPVALILLVGCASKPKPAPATQPLVVVYEPATANMLAFDPPVAPGISPLDLSRERRLASAFAGYDEGIVSYFYIRVDDDQSYDNLNQFNGSSSSNGATGDNSRYDRRTVIESSGVRFR